MVHVWYHELAPNWLYHKAIRWTILRFFNPFLHLILHRVPRKQIMSVQFFFFSKLAKNLNDTWVKQCIITQSYLHGSKKWKGQTFDLVNYAFVIWPLSRNIVGLINFILWYWVAIFFFFTTISIGRCFQSIKPLPASSRSEHFTRSFNW